MCALRLTAIAGMSGAELGQLIQETKGCIEGYHNSIACTRSTISNPQFVEHSVAAAEARIARDQAYIASLLDQQAHGFERIVGMQARILELESDLATLFNFSKIVQMSELAAKLEEQLGTTRMDLVHKLMDSPQPATV